MGQRVVAVLGGDERQAEAARFLASFGYRVQAAGVLGLERSRRLPDGEGAPDLSVADDVIDAVAGADAALLPVSGLDGEGRVMAKGSRPIQLTADHLEAWVKGRTHPVGGPVLFAGTAAPPWRELCQRYGVRLVVYRDRDDFAMWNALPTAEGALQMAMERTRTTIWGCPTAVLGFGRTADALARLLSCIGAAVTVVARDPRQRIAATLTGCEAVDFDRLGEVLGRVRLVFNTVPARVLDAAVLARAEPGTVIIDLASAPGGTDFEAAERLGLRATLAPGLPGLVAPETAGRIVADLVRMELTSCGLGPEG